MGESGTGTTNLAKVAQEACSDCYSRYRDVEYLRACDAIIELVDLLRSAPASSLRDELLRKLGVSA